MGHVSNFNGLNNCEETDMSRASSDLLSADHILDFNLTDSLLPFSDDAYQQSSLYASSSITFDQNDDDRNGYFDEPMFDLLFDEEHQFNIDFGVPESSVDTTSALETVSSQIVAVNRDEVCVKTEVSCLEENKSPLSPEQFPEGDVNGDLKDSKSNDSDQQLTSGVKTYTAILKKSESSDENSQIPKIVIKLKPELKNTEQVLVKPKVSKLKLIESESFAHELSLADSCAPLTIADNVKLGRRRTVNPKTEGEFTVKSSGVSHKKKSHHKKEHKSQKVKHSNKSFLNSSSSESYKHQPIGLEKSDMFVQSFAKDHNDADKNFLGCKEAKKSKELNSHSDQDEHGFDILDSPINSESAVHADLENAGYSGSNSFNFDIVDNSRVRLSSIDDDKELSDSVGDILEDLEITLGDGTDIPQLNKVLDDVPSVKEINGTIENLFPCVNGKENQDVEKDKTTDTKPLVTELIDELHAHHQQVFEEIEISTPDLELELSDMKNSIQVVTVESSQQMPNCAKSDNKQNGIAENTENTVNSQNHFKIKRTPSDHYSRPFLSESGSENALRSRKISSSNNSFSSKSTSHRSYRKRRSRATSTSSSSSSSDAEKFYNRPVKYDPVTDSYLDEFGREVRPTELKRYLKPKSNQRDSYSNNGSSSSTYSRSRSPHSRSRPKRHHRHSKSRSHKRRHSSSRSRSRSWDRKHKDSSRKTSSSSKHQIRKPHYMDLEENVKANEERRVMYVGDIPPGFTVEQLKERFSFFGPIQDATIKSKTTSDSSLYIFGFVTFKNKMDACNAIENGNNNPMWPKFDLNFGGRRRFCNGNYTDLDGKVAEYESGWYGHVPSYRHKPVQEEEDDFAKLLRLEQKRLGMAKK